MPRIALLAALLLAVSACTPDAPPTTASPHIVFILADDLGWGDVAAYAPASRIPTPHIDRLATSGLLLTDAHSPSAVCTPTRYAILTGRYAWRTRLQSGVLWPYAMPLLDPDRLTLADLLRQHGYATAAVGKWHLGWQWPRLDGQTSPADATELPDSVIDLSRPATGGPDAAGFDVYFGTSVPNFPPYAFLENGAVVGPEPTLLKPDSMFGHPGRMQDGWRLDRILPALAERADAWIRDRHAAQPDRPFFLYLPLTAPHTPIAPSAPWRGRSQAGAYGDFVAEVDGVVGRVLDTIDELGLAERTIVVFTSDNGSPARDGTAMSGPTGSVTVRFGHRPSGPWRGMKADIYEGGHRVPLIVRWPGLTRPGARSDELVVLTDFFAGFAGMLGVDLPEDAGEDSFDIRPVLRGGPALRDHAVHHSHTGMFALREGRWKLVLGRGSGGFTRPARITPGPGEPEGRLYDLDADSAETRNLWHDHPDVVQRLSARLDSIRVAGRSAP